MKHNQTFALLYTVASIGCFVMSWFAHGEEAFHYLVLGFLFSILSHLKALQGG